jgi:hypothetical protein
MLRIEDDVPVVAATLNLGLTSVAVGGGRYPCDTTTEASPRRCPDAGNPQTL